MYIITQNVLSLRFKANDIEFVVKKHAAGVTLRRSQSNEKRPLPSLERLDVGWVTVPPEHIVFLQSIAPKDCTEDLSRFSEAPFLVSLDICSTNKVQ